MFKETKHIFIKKPYIENNLTILFVLNNDCDQNSLRNISLFHTLKAEVLLSNST